MSVFILRVLNHVDALVHGEELFDIGIGQDEGQMFSPEDVCLITEAIASVAKAQNGDSP